MGLFDIFGDYRIYIDAIIDYFNGNPYKDPSFVYFPHFFLLMPLYINILIYIGFLGLCIVISVLYMRKNNFNKYATIIFGAGMTLFCLSGNIGVLIAMIALICLYYDNDYLTAILMAFVSFKPTVIIILPYFLWRVDDKFKSCIVYCLTFVGLNGYFLVNNPEWYFIFLQFERNRWAFVYFPFFRIWFFIVLYYQIEKKYRKKVYHIKRV